MNKFITHTKSVDLIYFIYIFESTDINVICVEIIMQFYPGSHSSRTSHQWITSHTIYSLSHRTS